MNIELDIPKGAVKEWVISYASDKLMELHKRDSEISSAKVCFKLPTTDNESKICEISLTIYGDSLFVHRKAASFEQAVFDALKDLTLKVDKQISVRNEPPDELTSTVKV